jgi:hypothetical protein
MTTHPLRLRDGHLYEDLEDGPWLLDTGAPSIVRDPRFPTFRTKLLPTFKMDDFPIINFIVVRKPIF